MNAFECLGATFGVILFAYFTLSPFLKKSKNQCQKRGQKSCFLMKNDDLAAQIAISSSILPVFYGLKKRSFYDVDSEGQEIN